MLQLFVLGCFGVRNRLERVNSEVSDTDRACPHVGARLVSTYPPVEKKDPGSYFLLFGGETWAHSHPSEEGILRQFCSLSGKSKEMPLARSAS